MTLFLSLIFIGYLIYIAIAVSGYFWWRGYDETFKTDYRYGTGGFPFGMQNWMKKILK